MSSSSQSPQATPTKAKLAVANGKAAPGDESPPKAPILLEEDFVDSDPGSSLPVSIDLPFALKDQIDSGVQINGSVSTQETSEAGRVEDVFAEQTGGEDEAIQGPYSEIQETRWRKMQSARTAAANPRITLPGNRSRVRR